MKTMPAEPKLAVLIDADNAQASKFAAILEEVAKYGNATVKRAYGNWDGEQLKSWKGLLQQFGIRPMQQYAYTTKKNATDFALIIDAMDLLHTENINGFCLVSSDSDFTPLAARIIEGGLPVYGFGERKTPAALVAVCKKFVYTENLGPQPSTSTATKTTPIVSAAKSVAPPVGSTSFVTHTAGVDATTIRENLRKDVQLIRDLRDAVEAASDHGLKPPMSGEVGWAKLSQVENFLVNTNPNFDPSVYDCPDIFDMLVATDLFCLFRDKNEPDVAYVRDPSGAIAHPFTLTLRKDLQLVRDLRKAVDDAADDDGWANLAVVGALLVKKSPDFDTRTYGCARLRHLIVATKLFAVEGRSPGFGKPTVIFVRDILTRCHRPTDILYDIRSATARTSSTCSLSSSSGRSNQMLRHQRSINRPREIVLHPGTGRAVDT